MNKKEEILTPKEWKTKKKNFIRQRKSRPRIKQTLDNFKIMIYREYQSIMAIEYWLEDVI